MKYDFLPPYSLDFNPIELAFLAMKYHLRCNGAYNRMVMTEMSDEEIHILLLKSIYIVSPQDCYGPAGIGIADISELTLHSIHVCCIVVPLYRCTAVLYLPTLEDCSTCHYRYYIRKILYFVVAQRDK